MPSINLGKVSLVPKGAWSNSNSYEKLNIVTYGGDSYIANKDVPVGTPLSNTEYWLNFASSNNIATQEMISTVTESMVAPKNLTAGDLVIVNDTLYRATANIASGATMTVGTNVIVTTIEEVTAPKYGVCDSANDTVAKTVSIPNFLLVTGSTVFVKFTNNNSVNNPTLNVNGTGDYPIYRYGTTAAGSTNATTGWPAGSVIALTFDGSAWMEHLWQNTQYTLYGAYCTTAADTAEKVATCTYFALRECWFEITLRYANTKKDALTLNVASTGALPIYINGTASSSSNYTLPKGQYIVYCDGSKYYFRTDGRIEGLCEEAPKDDKAYVRKNGTWVDITTL